MYLTSRSATVENEGKGARPKPGGGLEELATDCARTSLQMIKISLVIERLTTIVD